MCGRMVLTRTAHEVAEAFDVSAWPSECEFQPRYNVAPSQKVLALRQEPESGRELVPLHWGLIPSWSETRSTGYRMINARCETAGEKPSFRQALKSRRCIIASDGFYEWKSAAAAQGGQKSRGGKKPFLFQDPAGALLAMAGLWESWVDQGSGEVVESCAILTCEANSDMRAVHHRMPVLLARGDHSAWLDPRSELSPGIESLMRPAPAGQLESIEVSPWVNNPRNEDPRCVEPVSGATTLL